MNPNKMNSEVSPAPVVEVETDGGGRIAIQLSEIKLIYMPSGEGQGKPFLEYRTEHGYGGTTFLSVNGASVLNGEWQSWARGNQPSVLIKNELDQLEQAFQALRPYKAAYLRMVAEGLIPDWEQRLKEAEEGLR